MSIYMKLSTGEFPLYEGNIRLEHPEIPETATYPNFPCPNDFVPVQLKQAPRYDIEKECLRLGTPVLVDGKWECEYVIELLPRDLVEKRVKEKRDKLIKESDWTQIPDYPGRDKAEWTAYRQQLRDITFQPGFPWEINWPTHP